MKHRSSASFVVFGSSRFLTSNPWCWFSCRIRDVCRKLHRWSDFLPGGTEWMERVQEGNLMTNPEHTHTRARWFEHHFLLKATVQLKTPYWFSLICMWVFRQWKIFWEMSHESQWGLMLLDHPHSSKYLHNIVHEAMLIFSWTQTLSLMGSDKELNEPQ